MKIKCINSHRFSNITEGNIYEVVETKIVSNNLFYSIVNNSGATTWYSSKYFVITAEPAVEEVNPKNVSFEIIYGITASQNDDGLPIRIIKLANSKVDGFQKDVSATINVARVTDNCGFYGFGGIQMIPSYVQHIRYWVNEELTKRGYIVSFDQDLSKLYRDIIRDLLVNFYEDETYFGMAIFSLSEEADDVFFSVLEKESDATFTEMNPNSGNKITAFMISAYGELMQRLRNDEKEEEDEFYDDEGLF